MQNATLRTSQMTTSGTSAESVASCSSAMPSSPDSSARQSIGHYLEMERLKERLYRCKKNENAGKETTCYHKYVYIYNIYKY